MTKNNSVYGKDIPIGFERLNACNTELIVNFRCGNEYIDTYFQEKAASDKSATTYLFKNKSNDEARLFGTKEGWKP